MVTRAAPQAGKLARLIEGLGGEAIVFPTIEILPPEDYGPLDRAIERIGDYQWLFFTSANGVERFLARLAHCRKTVEELRALRIAAIGPETAKRLAAAGLSAVVPQDFRAEGLLEAVDPDEIRGKKILLPRVAGAREILPETLRRWGGTVDVVEAYRTVPPGGDGAAALRRMFRDSPPDAITFTSSSTAKHFAEMFPGESLAGLLRSTVIACIGPVTSRTVTELGLRADIVAGRYTIEGLVEALVEYFGSPAVSPPPGGREAG